LTVLTLKYKKTERELMKVYRNISDAVDDYGKAIKENRTRRIILTICALVFIIAFLAKCGGDEEGGQAIITDPSSGPVVPVEPTPEPDRAFRHGYVKGVSVLINK
jgi:hypothetical protein